MDRVHAVNPELWKLWKEYRALPWSNEPPYFRLWLKGREKRPSLDWSHPSRGDVVQQTTMELDGFHIVIKVRYDEDTSLNDSDCYGTYDDSPEDHYALDRPRGETSYCGRHYSDSRERWYNEPRHSSYEKQRDPWLNVYALEDVNLSAAVGRVTYHTGEKLDAAGVQALRDAGFNTVFVRGRVVRRCRYGGVGTRSKSVDDVTVRGYIRKNQELVDDWYNNQWYFYDIYAVAYMGEVEMATAGCGGVDSVDDNHIDEVAWDVANEAACEARTTFDKMRGTSDSRCELIAKVSGAAADVTDEALHAWLGFLYAAIARGEALDVEDAPLCFDEFLREKKLRGDVKLYLKREDNDDD